MDTVGSQTELSLGLLVPGTDGHSALSVPLNIPGWLKPSSAKAMQYILSIIYIRNLIKVYAYWR